MIVRRISQKLVNEINQKCLNHWKQPKYIKPDLNKLLVDMKNDSEFKDKVWIPLSDSEVERHLYKFRDLYKLDDTSGRGC